jgi:hypothetical protein
VPNNIAQCWWIASTRQAWAFGKQIPYSLPNINMSSLIKYSSIVLGFFFLWLVFAALGIFFIPVDAKDAPSAATVEMSKVIGKSQARVAEIDKETASLQAERSDLVAQVQVFRSTICATDKARGCNAEILDPAKAGVDIASFLAPAAK